MTREELIDIINNGEKINVEFKLCSNALNKDVYDTVCSFNNSNGGHIILGVDDNKNIVGVQEDKIDQIIKDFTTTINNDTKIYPPLYITPIVIEIATSKKVIYIKVPEGRHVCRRNGIIFDRTYEGDINISNNEELVYKLYARKQSDNFVNKVYPNLGIDFLDKSLIERVRKRAVVRNNNHPWGEMTDEEILRSSGLILSDPETGKEGLTLAAILLLGYDSSIMSVLPQYKTDAIYRVENLDRYDDRDVVITNLIDSYDRLIEFGRKHLNDIFILDGIQNVSARDKILREIVSNILAHRDYSSAFIAKMIIESDSIYAENASMPHIEGKLKLDKFEPFPKNPPISKFFREIGLADELGSGMRNTNKYTKLYSKGEPVFEDGNVFKVTIPLKNIATLKVGPSSEKMAIKNGDKKTAIKIGDKNNNEEILDTVQVANRLNAILEFMELNKEYSISDISTSVGLKDSRTRELLTKLVDRDILQAIGKNKSRRYIRIK